MSFARRGAGGADEERALAARAFVAFGGLVAYLYFVDAKKPVTEEGAEKRDKVFTVEGDKIQELRVMSSSGETSTLKKARTAGSCWSRSRPKSTRARSRESRATSRRLKCRTWWTRRPPTCSHAGSTSRGSRCVQDGGRQGLPAPPRRQQDADSGDLYAQRAGEKKVFLISSYWRAASIGSRSTCATRRSSRSTARRSIDSRSPTTM